MKKWLRFLQRQRRDADLRRELEAYLEHEAASQIANGRRPEDARWGAMRKLGNMTRIREDVYERNSLVTLETLWQDVVYALRLLRHNPGFAIVAILSMALGIGSNASVFTLLDQVMLRRLPVDRADELVLVTTRGFQYGNAWGDGNELSHPMYVDLRDNNQVFSGMFGRFGATVDATFDGSGERVRVEFVTGTYFPVLGVTAAAGRVFDPSDDRASGGHPVVIISHRFWRERFRLDPMIVGRGVRIGPHPMTIVGVARAGFDGTSLGLATDVFVPIAMPAAVGVMADERDNRRLRWVSVFGRLKPGVTPEQALAGLEPFYKSRLAFEVQQAAFARASAQNKTQFLEGSIEVTPASYGKSEVRKQLGPALWLLGAIGAGVLVIATANVANLLLARAGARRREIAVRLALGATRRRVVRQLLVESVLLAVAGTAAGLVLATWGAQMLLSYVAELETALTITAWPDGRILAITVSMAVAIGVLFGLAPVWQSTSPDVAPALKTESVGVLGGGNGRLRKGLVIVQVALSLLLLVGAALFVRSLDNLLSIDAGFDTERLLTFSVSSGSTSFGPAQTKALAKTLLERVRAVPGVEQAAFVSHGLLEGGSWNNRMTVEGRPYQPNERPVAHNNLIAPGYFQTMGVRLLAGRDFDTRDELPAPVGSTGTAPRVAIASEQFVKQYLGGRQPLGIHIGFGSDPGTPTPIEIVGVVETTKHVSVRSAPQPQLYFPFLEVSWPGSFRMYVRTTQPPASLGASVRQAIREVNPSPVVYEMRTVDEQVRRSLVRERVIAGLSSVLGVLATLLAMIGLYGVMSYTVARRTREIAIRVAFGAASSRLARLIIRDMLTLVVSGLALALGAFWWLSRFITSILYEVAPFDPVAFVAASGLLLAAAAAAVAVPSRRALRVNPMAALRQE